jgi:hypothetical protein
MSYVHPKMARSTNPAPSSQILPSSSFQHSQVSTTHTANDNIQPITRTYVYDPKRPVSPPSCPAEYPRLNLRYYDHSDVSPAREQTPPLPRRDGPTRAMKMALVRQRYLENLSRANKDTRRSERNTKNLHIYTAQEEPASADSTKQTLVRQRYLRDTSSARRDTPHTGGITRNLPISTMNRETKSADNGRGRSQRR